MNYIAISNSNTIARNEVLMKMNHASINMMQKFLYEIISGFKNQEHFFLEPVCIFHHKLLFKIHPVHAMETIQQCLNLRLIIIKINMCGCCHPVITGG